jgi:hypothetical protein
METNMEHYFLPDSVARRSLLRHLLAVRTIEEIKMAISNLSLEERAEVVAELCGWTDDDWDHQMKAAAAAGKFVPLNCEAEAAHITGQTVPLDNILREP